MHNILLSNFFHKAKDFLKNSVVSQMFHVKHFACFTLKLKDFKRLLRNRFYFFILRIYPKTAVTAAGVTPEIREAAPKVAGRTFSNFMTTSFDNPPIFL